MLSPQPSQRQVQGGRLYLSYPAAAGTQVLSISLSKPEELYTSPVLEGTAVQNSLTVQNGVVSVLLNRSSTQTESLMLCQLDSALQPQFQQVADQPAVSAQAGQGVLFAAGSSADSAVQISLQTGKAEQVALPQGSTVLLPVQGQLYAAVPQGENTLLYRCAANELPQQAGSIPANTQALLLPVPDASKLLVQQGGELVSYTLPDITVKGSMLL